MAEESDKGPENVPAEDVVREPRIANLVQYVKDLSFESPNSPTSLLGDRDTANGELSIQIKVRPLDNDQYEVVLHFEIEGTNSDETAFLVELQYAGVFVVSGFSDEDHQKALMIECPYQLFPFARRVIADAVRDGGFPQLMLETIDFVQLYRHYQQENQDRESRDQDS